MARLWSSGLELNSLTTGVELAGVGGSSNGSGTRSIVTSPVNSGTYALRHAPSSSTARTIYGFVSTNTADGFYFRAYVRVASYPSAQIRLMYVASNISQMVAIRINTDGTLELWNQEDSAQIGSDSAVLSLNMWYRIEMKVDCTTVSSTAIAARIDGIEFASGTINIASGIQTFVLGDTTVASHSVDIYFDDLAINDDSGSFQNSWPGAGKIVHLKPNAAGDNNQLGSAASTNYQQVDEVTPDDVTTTISTASDSVGEIDDYNIEDATDIGTNDTISLVAVGQRFAAGSATAAQNDSATLRIKAASGGTVETSTALQPTGTSYVTNAPNGSTTNLGYPLTLYDLPGASTTAWTKADLDTTQIGWTKSADSTSGFIMSTVWALVEYVPGAGTQTVNPSALATTTTFYAPTITTGGVAVSPSLLSANTTLYAPTVSPGSVTVSPSLISSNTTVFSPAVTPGTVTLSPGSISSATQLYDPTTTANVTVSVFHLPSSTSIYQPSTSVGGVTLSPGLLSSLATVFDPSVSGVTLNNYKVTRGARTYTHAKRSTVRGPYRVRLGPKRTTKEPRR